MADGISFKFDAAPFRAFLDDRERRMRQAAMYNVRAGGRVVRVAARAAAPVLKNKHAVRFRAWKKAGVSAGNAPVVGLLRNSIKPSKRLKYDGVTWSLKVGPRGQRVHLYAGKEEERRGYMRAGFAAAEADMAAIAERTYQKVWVEK